MSNLRSAPPGLTEAVSSRIIGDFDLARGGVRGVIPFPQHGVSFVPNPKPSDDFRNISVLARGETLRAIKRIADTDGISLGRAALMLVERGIAADHSLTPAPAAGPIASATVNLEAVSIDDLMDEITGRLVLAADEAARADAAEARLAAVASAMSGV